MLYYLFAIFKNILLYYFILMLLCQIVIEYMGMIDSYIKAHIRRTYYLILIIICIMLKYFMNTDKHKKTLQSNRKKMALDIRIYINYIVFLGTNLTVIVSTIL